METRPALRGLRTRINYWPGIVDMLTSMLLFFLLAYWVETNFSAASAQLAVARQKQARFVAELRHEFADEIGRGQVEYASNLNLLQVRFGDGVLFRSREWELNARGAALLRRLSRVFHRVDRGRGEPLYEQIQVEGHTDDRPLRGRTRYPRDNWELSTARATAVMRFLADGPRPLDERRMSVNGYAANRPVSEVRSQNRRIEIRIYFSGRPADAEAAP